ncbi:YkvA family protein [Dokdonella sp. MW10]|uniref:YkvA family protein n=1 Tax=Dokdonella sp. MW10 TaxID=2992926 RepID=UPI003F7F3C80
MTQASHERTATRQADSGWRATLRAMRAWALTAYFAARDPAAPWLPRVLALAVAAYAFSPIDLIPDAIPILGLLDDVILVPLGLLLVIRLMPKRVLARARRRARDAAMRPVSRSAAAVIVAVWLVAAFVVAAWLMRIHASA